MASESERMTSSNPPRRRRYARFLWLPLLLVLLCIAYTLAWMHFAGVIRQRVEATLAALRETGATADCADHEVHGFPLRFILQCKSIRYVDPASASVFSAASMLAFATIYDPRRIHIRLAAPALVQAPNTGPIVVHWKRMQGELFPPLGHDASVEVRGKMLVAERTQAEWIEVFEGTEACVAGIIPMTEAVTHPHLVARETFVERHGQVQPAPAPRFSRTEATLGLAPAPQPGADTRAALAAWGIDDVDGLIERGAAIQA